MDELFQPNFSESRGSQLSSVFGGLFCDSICICSFFLATNRRILVSSLRFCFVFFSVASFAVDFVNFNFFFHFFLPPPHTTFVVVPLSNFALDDAL